MPGKLASPDALGLRRPERRCLSTPSKRTEMEPSAWRSGASCTLSGLCKRPQTKCMPRYTQPSSRATSTSAGLPEKRKSLASHIPAGYERGRRRVTCHVHLSGVCTSDQCTQPDTKRQKQLCPGGIKQDATPNYTSDLINTKLKILKGKQTTKTCNNYKNLKETQN